MLPKICSIPECGRSDRVVRGWCRMHHGRWERHGDPNVSLRIINDDPKRFWSKVRKAESCWIWTGTKDALGYGRFSIGGSQRPAHRVSFEFTKGPIAPGLVIDHKCHNTSCVNPEHLRATTHKQNLENRSGANQNSKSGVRGVGWDKDCNRWRGQVMHNGRSIYVGIFESIPEAEAAVTAKRLEIFTHNDLDRLSS